MWGYRRIQGDLATMGIPIARRASGRSCSDTTSNLRPGDQGRLGQSSSECRRRVSSCATFTVDTVLLRRLYVLFFVHHDARLVRIAGVTAKPVTDWVTQTARNISMELGE